MKTNRTWIIISGILGFLGVAIGAFGAHALKNALTPELTETYRTGVTYHLIHTVVIAAIALSGKEKLFSSAFFFTIGIILFSFSLYLYSITGITWIAMITPFGGISFLAGWGMMIVKGWRVKNIN